MADKILFIVTKDRDGFERLYVRRTYGSVRLELSRFRRQLKTFMGVNVPPCTEKVVRHFVGPKGNYILDHALSVDDLGGSEVMNELDQLVKFLVPIAQGLATGTK